MNNRMESSPRIRGGPAPVKTLGSLQGLLLLRRVEYKVRQNQQMVEAKDIEDILNSMYPRGTWRL